MEFQLYNNLTYASKILPQIPEREVADGLKLPHYKVKDYMKLTVLMLCHWRNLEWYAPMVNIN